MAGILSKAKEKYDSYPVHVKASFFFVLCGVFKDAVDVIATPIFTRLLTTDEYGLFGVYNSWYQIVRIIITLSLFSDSFNVGMARFGEDSERFASSQQGLITTMLIFWSGVWYIARGLLGGVIDIGVELVVLMLLQVLFSSGYYIWFQKKRYRYSYKILTAVTLTYTAMQPLLGIVLIKLNTRGFDNGVLRIVTGVGVQIAFGLVFYVIQFCRSRTFFHKKYWKFALKLNIPLLPHYLSQILLNQSDKLMIDAFSGKTSTAIYSVAHSAAFVLQAVTTNLNATLVPWLYEKLKRKNYEGIRRAVTGIVLLSAVVVMCLVLVAPEAMKVFADDEYREGIWIIPPLAFSVYLILVYMLFSNLELFFEKSNYILVSSVVGAISNIVLNYIFIRKIGYLAAGYTTVAGYVLMCIGHIIFAYITCKKESVPFSELYDLKAIGIVTMSLFAVCAGIMFLYDHTVVRYAVLLAVALLLFIFRAKLSGFIKKLKTRTNQ